MKYDILQITSICMSIIGLMHINYEHYVLPSLSIIIGIVSFMFWSDKMYKIVDVILARTTFCIYMVLGVRLKDEWLLIFYVNTLFLVIMCICCINNMHVIEKNGRYIILCFIWVYRNEYYIYKPRKIL